MEAVWPEYEPMPLTDVAEHAPSALRHAQMEVGVAAAVEHAPSALEPAQMEVGDANVVMELPALQ